MQWTREDERVYRLVKSLIRETRVTLTHLRFGKIEFERSGERFIRRDVLSDGREVIEKDVPSEAVEVVMFQAIKEGWKVCR